MDTQHLEGTEEDQEEADENIFNILASQNQKENPFQMPEKDSGFGFGFGEETEFDREMGKILGF